MKKILILFIIFSLMMTGCGLKENTGKFIDDEPKETTDSVAIINGEEVSEEYFERQYAMISQRFQMYNMELSRMKLLEEAIIPQVVFVQEAKKENIKVTNQEVNDFVNSEMDTITERLTEEELQSELDKLGITFEELKEDNKLAYRTQLYIQRLLNKTVWSEIEVEEQEVRNYFDNNPEQFDMGSQIKASHILINIDNDTPDADAKAKIEKIEAEINDDGDFEELAKEYSDCPSASKGGDLGYFGKGMMVPEFEEVAFNLQVGKISEPVKTQFGYHIIKVTAKKDAGKVQFSEVKEQIEQQLYAAKQKAAEETYSNQLISKADIEILLKEEITDEEVIEEPKEIEINLEEDLTE